MADLPLPSLPPSYPPSPPSEREDLPAFGPGSLAGIGTRAAARVIDFVLWVMLLPSLTLTSYVEDGKIDADRVPLALLIALPLVYPLADFALTAWRGQTIGKLAIGVRVARYDDGGRPSVRQAAIRTIIPMLSMLVSVVLPGIGLVLVLISAGIYLTATSNPVLRGLHDRAAGTIVLRTR